MPPFRSPIVGRDFFTTQPSGFRATEAAADAARRERVKSDFIRAQTEVLRRGGEIGPRIDAAANAKSDSRAKILQGFAALQAAQGKGRLTTNQDLTLKSRAAALQQRKEIADATAVRSNKQFKQSEERLTRSSEARDRNAKFRQAFGITEAQFKGMMGQMNLSRLPGDTPAEKQDAFVQLIQRALQDLGPDAAQTASPGPVLPEEQAGAEVTPEQGRAIVDEIRQSTQGQNLSDDQIFQLAEDEAKKRGFSVPQQGL